MKEELKSSRVEQDIKQASLFGALERQRERLAERKTALLTNVQVCGIKVEVLPGVYHTSVDTELMARAVRVRPTDRFVEIGCGCGAVTIVLAKKCRFGTGVDINMQAVENARRNADTCGAENVAFLVSDVFSNVTGRFDVLICNPPYNRHDASDVVDQMFWDPGDRMKRRFFNEASRLLKARGRIYLGWADFAELDTALPLRLAAEAGLKYICHYVSSARNGTQRFFVIKFGKRRASKEQ